MSVRSILKQAQEDNFNINEKNSDGNYLFLWAVVNNNIEVAQLVIDYANKNNTILNVTDSDNDGDDPLMYTIYNNHPKCVN